jgi:hypothetical protein
MREAFVLFTAYPFQVIKRYLARERFTRLFTMGLFVLVMGFIALLVYAMTYAGMEFINNNQELRDAFQVYLIQLFVLIVTGLSIGNAVLVSAASFGRRSHQWIMATPGYSIMGIVQIFQMTLSSSWIFLGVIVPVLLAVSQFGPSPVVGFVLGLLMTVFLVILASSIGVIAFLGVINILRALSRVYQKSLVQISKALLVLIGIGLMSIYMIWRVAVPQDFVVFFEGGTAVQIETIEERFRFVPTTQIADTLYQSLLAGSTTVGVFIAIYGLLAILSVALVYALLQEQYLILWQMLQEGQFIADKAKKDRRKTTQKSIKFNTQNTVETIVAKELLLIWRDKKNLFWLIMVSVLWILQTLVTIRITYNVRQYDVELTSLPDFLFAIVFAVGMYFVSALVLRFVFPTFSAERKVAWILGVAPISIWKITIGKVMVYTGLFTFMGSILLIANYLLLDLDTGKIIEFWIVFTISVLFTILLATYLSIRYPNRYSDDPEILSTTLPGLVFTALALLVSFIVSWAIYRSLSTPWMWGMTVAILITSSWFLMTLIHKETKEFEYVGEIVA